MPAPSESVSAERLSLALVGPVSEEVPVCSGISFKVKASCAAGSDLRGGRINLLAQEEVVATLSLIDFHDGVNETGAFMLAAPDTVGAFTWNVHFLDQEIGGVRYEDASLPIQIRTKPLQASLAVWDIPSSVLIGERFTIKVGAKSSGACQLKGAHVEVRDESGEKVGEGAFGDTPLPQTDALFWTEISLTAPSRAGTHSWRAAFVANELKLPHEAASTTFGFSTVKRPEHRLMVKVVENDVATPIANVQLGVGPYRAATDDAGAADVHVAAGRYQLDLWHAEFEFVSQEVEVSQDTAVQVELTRLPKERTPWD
jgi:hypothetical protein